MAKKNASTTPSKGKSSAATTDSPAPVPRDVAATSATEADLTVDKVPVVNNASLSELKNTCDDIVKEFFSRPTAFTRSHVHEDVRLGLGWTSVIIALGTAYYSYVTPFEESKTWVTLGVGAYAVLNTLLVLYATYFEQNIIFSGKRRTFASRISTEVLTISSSAQSTPSLSPASSFFPALPFLSSSSSATTSPSGAAYPIYTLDLAYSHSSNNGKSLIHQSQVKIEKCFGEFFDANGRVAKPKFEQVLEKALVDVVGE